MEGIDKKDLRALTEEFCEKLEHDPYQPGVVHPEIYPDDIQEVLEDLLFLRGFSEATIKVNRKSGISIQLDVLSRS